MAVIDKPIFTTSTSSFSESELLPGGVLVVGCGPEERAKSWPALANSVPTRVIELSETDELTIAAASMNGRTFELPLRNPDQLLSIADMSTSRSVDIDLTSLPTHIWAPLIKAYWEANVRIRAFYVEPGDYTQSSAPTEGELFDLSERINGIAPLPGFSSISKTEDGETVFIPLLGFEGSRLAHVVESLEPAPENIYPIIGVPGFRPSYPFHTYLGNQSTIQTTGSARNIHYSRANCPFSAFYCIEAITSRRGSNSVQLAPLGTRPHGLGSVLFYLASRETVEIIYDHPRKKAGRTSGVSRSCIYDISAFKDFLRESRT
ncbi:hypothetical protein SAMN05428982_0520 [Pseudoxanthomonas sp. CF385]|uniref:hypothetical protein n=1 Tax=Pseudoxanthomonas sp. CF385 TaxID=1881042 RepID=UPI00088A9B0E|nr:hypothetical protein [Pseudoxanthomonas sp. CF385]SDQ29800.1 hypothetical protein SAMN05428982_0520 [Pseudoxanthomonas sp. CF385]